MDSAWAYVGVTLFGTVAGQLLLKTAVARHGAIPSGVGAIVSYLGRALADPLILGSFALAFISALAWIAATSRLSLSKAYPFMSLAFVVTTVLSAVLLHESVSARTWIGVGVVTVGLILVARG